MYARVVRFTGVDSDRVNETAERIKSGEGPPPGVPAKRILMLSDEGENNVVVVVFFDSEEDMKAGGEALDAMDSGDTPGTRASVDNCEVKADMTA
jgi:hypothetical protein